MNNFNHLKHKPNAVKFLGNHLRNGSLVLYLGAGTSKGFGLPGWVDLINSMRSEVGLDSISDDAAAEKLQVAADEVSSKLGNESVFIELIKKHLYKDRGDVTTIDSLENHLLIAVAAMLMGSKRGHVTRVVTLNFDSMLEWFLSIFGFVVKSVYHLPELEGSEDVRIYHPHGYIPHPNFASKSSESVILGMNSVNRRLGTPGNPWIEMTRHILDTSVCLFIGMSGTTLNDRALEPLLLTSGEKVQNERPLGIWIIKGTLDESKEGEFLRNNLIPICITEEKAISEFLLQICQEAMKI